MTEAVYLSCPHITRSILTYTLERIIEVENSSCSFACLSCESMFPSLTGLKNHYLERRHEIYVRIGDRPDLYCARCEDFQYCSYFDSIIGKKRKLRAASGNVSSSQAISSKSRQVRNESSPRPRSFCPGLVNMGSTCFMNSVLQVLAHCRQFSFSPHFRSHVASCPITSQITNSSSVGSDSRVPTPSSQVPACIPCEFFKVSEFLSGDETREPVVVPSQLLYAIWSFVDYMAGYSQQDAHEFLIAFLNSLAAQLDGANDSRDANNFSKMFTGTVQSQLSCSVCGNTSTTNESFIDLSLTVDRHTDDDDSNGADVPMDVLDSIEHFTAAEILHEKVRCETCGIEQERTKQLRLVKVPDLLVLHFKRFDFFKQRKMSKPIRFPLSRLNLEKFKIQPDENSPELSELIGVVCHHGTLHQGHYISYIFDRKLASWMKCDDENVTVVDEKEVLAVEAYLLFYQKTQS